MKAGQRAWTREELILAVNLYCKLPFGKMHKGTPEIKQLAALIDRTPSSVALKLGNFASFDPTLKEGGIKSASNASKLDKEVWNEFYDNWDQALIQSEELLAARQHTTVEEINNISETFSEGLEKERVIRTRVNQHIFRRILLAGYRNTCCITGIMQTQLLVASHILPWSKSHENRLNPMNGLLLNALHDKAFEHGLITIDAETYHVQVSSMLMDQHNSKDNIYNFKEHHNREITLPDKFLPSKEFLKFHNDHRFKQ